MWLNIYGYTKLQFYAYIKSYGMLYFYYGPNIKAKIND